MEKNIFKVLNSGEFRIYVTNGNVKLNGYATGKLSIEKIENDTMVVKENGHSYWYSLPPAKPTFAPMNFKIYQILETGFYDETETTKVYVVKKLIEFVPERKSRKEKGVN